MKKAKRNKKRYLSMGIFGIVLALLLTGASVLFLIKFMYIPSVIFAVLSAYGYYSAVFFMFSYSNMRALIKLLPILEKHGEAGLSEIARAMKWKEKGTLKFIRRYRKRGYIR